QKSAAEISRQPSEGEKTQNTAALGIALEQLGPKEFKDLADRSSKFSGYLVENVAAAVA
ncbi:unnamed protein product, partial [Heterosigma akashiwo]